MASKISKEISLIKAGLGDKVGKCIQQIATFLFGFGVAFYRGWLLTCIYLASIPVMFVAGALSVAAYKGGAVASLKAYS